MIIFLIRRVHQSITLRCTICGADSNYHEPDCPQHTLETLVARQRYIFCPKCNKAAIDVNADDYYECRACHAQFTTSGMLINPELHFLDDPRASDLVVVALLPNEGKGNFPLDRQVEEARKRYEAAVKKARRRTKQ